MKESHKTFPRALTAFKTLFFYSCFIWWCFLLFVELAQQSVGKLISVHVSMLQLVI